MQACGQCAPGLKGVSFKLITGLLVTNCSWTVLTYEVLLMHGLGLASLGTSHLVTKVYWALHLHSLLSFLKDSDCELLLQHSYLNICKISYLLHTVPRIKPWTSYNYLITSPKENSMLLCVWNILATILFAFMIRRPWALILCLHCPHCLSVNLH